MYIHIYFYTFQWKPKLSWNFQRNDNSQIPDSNLRTKQGQILVLSVASKSPGVSDIFSAQPSPMKIDPYPVHWEVGRSVHVNVRRAEGQNFVIIQNYYANRPLEMVLLFCFGMNVSTAILQHSCHVDLRQKFQDCVFWERCISVDMAMWREVRVWVCAHGGKSTLVCRRWMAQSGKWGRGGGLKRGWDVEKATRLEIFPVICGLRVWVARSDQKLECGQLLCVRPHLIFWSALFFLLRKKKAAPTILDCVWKCGRRYAAALNCLGRRPFFWDSHKKRGADFPWIILDNFLKCHCNL